MRTLGPPRRIRRLLGRGTWADLAAAVFCGLFLLSGCVPIASSPSLAPLPTAAPAQSNTGSSQVAIYAPSTTSSVPVILATEQLRAAPVAAEDLRLTIFSNHSQANTLFLRGDIDVLVTGLSVGVEFHRNGAPVQVINCYVTGLTYLVTYGRPVAGFADLRGGDLYVPFEGSPIEETSRFLAEHEGLVWKRDIRPVYAPSDSALALLKQGKAAAVALPEPLVTLAEQGASGAGAAQAKPYVSFGYAAKWNAVTGTKQGYPQVCTFVKRAWAESHPQAIARLNDALTRAILEVQRDPAAAARQSAPSLGFDQKMLLRALSRTDFHLNGSDAMVQEVRGYYRTVGKPLDAGYDSFFYR